MTTVISCDGCGKVLGPNSINHAIHGERANDMSGVYPLPQGEFDWCQSCAKTAFEAVRAIRSMAATDNA